MAGRHSHTRVARAPRKKQSENISCNDDLRIIIVHYNLVKNTLIIVELFEEPKNKDENLC